MVKNEALVFSMLVTCKEIVMKIFLSVLYERIDIVANHGQVIVSIPFHKDNNLCDNAESKE